MNPDSYTFPWDTQAHYFHNVRVLCDLAGLTVEQKNIVCACIFQESRFRDYHPDGTPIDNQNRDKETGLVWSTDWGLVQVNDYWNIGEGKPFPSVDYVLKNPHATALFMINEMKATNELKDWASYTSGAFKPWLSPESPMWLLATPA